MSKMSDEMIDMKRPYTWTDNRLIAGLVAAFAATFFATMFGEWFYSIGWVPFSFNTLNADVWANNFKLIGGTFYGLPPLSSDFTYFLGMWSHYSQGIVFGLVFTLLVYPNLPGPMKVGNNLLKGLLWGWTLWIVSSSFVMPLLYGTGFWFSYWGTLGLPNGSQSQLIFYNFVWHSIYGFALGMFFSPVSKSEADMPEAPKKMMSLGPIGHWAQVIVGWIVLIVGGWIASMGAVNCGTGSAGFGGGITACPAGTLLSNGWLGAGQAAAPWGVLVGLIGLIIATGPYFAGRWMKK
jgi:hypothetical protein